MGKSIQANYADMAVGSIGLLTMMSRKVVSFASSIGGMVVLAVIGWFLLSKFA